MKLILEGDTRRPTAGWLTYSADIDMPDPAKPMGPNTLGEWLWPVAIERTADATRVGFSHVAPLVVAS